MRSATFLSALGLIVGCAAVVPAKAGRTLPQQPQVQIKMPSHGSFAGTVANGIADGVYWNGDKYQGGWKDGKPDGIGTMTYALGGAYQGEWKDGRRDGKGVMRFAGSGRTTEVRFADDRRIDVAMDSPSAGTESTQFFLASEDETTGSHIRTKVAYSPLPLDHGFDQLTPDQQRFVRAWYPALDAGDTPPYPLKGGKELYKLLVYLARHIEPEDDVLVYVDVDKEGQVTQVSTMSPLDDKVRRLIGAAAGLLKYQPARCGGQPCAGVVPFNVRLSTNY